jgi:hypothetical protein
MSNVHTCELTLDVQGPQRCEEIMEVDLMYLG